VKFSQVQTFQSPFPHVDVVLGLWQISFCFKLMITRCLNYLMNAISGVQFMAIDANGVLWYMAFVALFYVECNVGVVWCMAEALSNLCKQMQDAYCGVWQSFNCFFF
jgi:hypothetical protein